MVNQRPTNKNPSRFCLKQTALRKRKKQIKCLLAATKQFSPWSQMKPAHQKANIIFPLWVCIRSHRTPSMCHRRPVQERVCDTSSGLRCHQGRRLP